MSDPTNDPNPDSEVGSEGGPVRREPPADDRLPPLARVVFYLPAYLIAQLVTAVFAAQVWISATGLQLSDLTEVHNELVLALGLAAAFSPVAVVGTWWFTRGLDRRTLADLGWQLPRGTTRAVRETLGSCGGGALLLALWLGVGSFGFELTWSGWAALGSRGLLSASGLGLVFLGVVLAAAVEELVFRGYVFHVLKERGTWASAAGLQAALFAALHGSNPDMNAAGLVNTFLLGLALAAMVELTGSLYAATAAHATWNFLLALGLPLSGLTSLGVAKITISGPEGWTGGAYGPEGSWVLSGLLVPAVCGLALWADRARSARNGDGGAPVGAPEGPQRW